MEAHRGGDRPRAVRPWAKDDASRPRPTRACRSRGRCDPTSGWRSRRRQKIAFLEAKKVGTRPHYAESDRECFLAVKPGYARAVRTRRAARSATCARARAVNARPPPTASATASTTKRSARSRHADEAVAPHGDGPGRRRRQLPRSEALLVGRRVLHAEDDELALGRQGRPLRQSKCMCVLVDNTLTAEATQDAETQMCSYTPMEVDEAAVAAGRRRRGGQVH